MGDKMESVTRIRKATRRLVGDESGVGEDEEWREGWLPGSARTSGAGERIEGAKPRGRGQTRSDNGEVGRGSKEGGNQRLTEEMESDFARPSTSVFTVTRDHASDARSRRYRDVVLATVWVAIITYFGEGREVGGYGRYRAGGDGWWGSSR